jgi:RNA polymerase sigma-70 factor (ECF subfamily)
VPPLVSLAATDPSRIVLRRPSAASLLAEGELEAIMIRYVAGAPGAFAELHAMLRPIVRAIVGRATPGRTEDMMQVVFLKIHAARESWRSALPLLPWIHAIARNTVRDERRRIRRDRLRLTDDGLAPDVPGSLACFVPVGPLPASEDGPISDDPRLHDRALLAALRALPPRQRTALLLTKLDDASCGEAAARLCITPLALRLLVHRASKKLQLALGGQRRGAIA